MARIGKVAPAPKCRSPAQARPESAPAAGLGLCVVPGRADLFRKFIARTLVVDPWIIRGVDDRDNGGDRGWGGGGGGGGGAGNPRWRPPRGVGGFRGRGGPARGGGGPAPPWRFFSRFP